MNAELVVLETKMERQLVESLTTMLDNFVDPRERYMNGQEDWTPVADDDWTGGFQDEWQLKTARQQCKLLAAANGFGINGHENRINYVIGTGHKYQAAAKKKGEAESLIEQTQLAIDDFVRVNQWPLRQRENMLRWDRDGEVFLRFFEQGDNLIVRYVEPSQIEEPSGREDHETWGIRTVPDDVETVTHYHIDGEWVDANQIQHRKANVNFNVKRGVPTFWPVRHNLDRAVKVQRSMSLVALIQASIGMVKKVNGVSPDRVQSIADGAAVLKTTNAMLGTSERYERVEPRILTTNGIVEYEFPAHNIAAPSFSIVVQAELRAAAARVQMPEFMFTSDASNANYSSTMVAQNPCIKSFEAQQQIHVEFDRAIIRRHLELRVARGQLPPEALTELNIVITPPTLTVEDAMKETQRRQILKQENILSPQTWAELEKLDYENEMDNIEKHRDKYPVLDPNLVVPVPGEPPDKGAA